MLLADRYLLTLLSFFFTDTSPTEIYTLSLHDALPIYFTSTSVPQAESGDVDAIDGLVDLASDPRREEVAARVRRDREPDRKSTRLNSSHVAISYAVFCLKKKKKQE